MSDIQRLSKREKLWFFNVICMILFWGSIFYFSGKGASYQTVQVLYYFIPDMVMSALNITLTFILQNQARKTHKLLKYTKFLIDISYYVNLITAVFYIWLYADKKIFGDRSDAFYSDVGIINKLWEQFDEIMKFKITATLHAIGFKHYVDYVWAYA